MAPARADSDDSKYSPPSLEEIIFSCGICQATVSDLYPSDADDPHSHSGDENGMGTKLWIANCVHIFCARHLDGGGEWLSLFANAEVTLLIPQAFRSTRAMSRHKPCARFVFGTRTIMKFAICMAFAGSPRASWTRPFQLLIRNVHPCRSTATTRAPKLCA